MENDGAVGYVERIISLTITITRQETMMVDTNDINEPCTNTNKIMHRG